MKVQVFSIYDSKAEAYLPPMFLQSKGLALRAFSDAVNKTGHDLNKWAADYTLFHIAEYDDERGEIEMLPNRQNLGSGNEFLENNNNIPTTSPTASGLLQEAEKIAEGPRQ